MEEADVVVAWDFAPVPPGVRSQFQRPTKFLTLPTPPNRGYAAQLEALGWPTPIRAAIAQHFPGLRPLRVAALGFSESCHGVRNLLNSGDGRRLDAVVAIDGIHTPYLGGKVDPNTMKPWLEFAKLAVVNERLFVATHSSIVPGSYASTTETCDYLWRTITGSDEPFVNPALPDLSAPPTTIHVQGGTATGPDRKIYYAEPQAQAPKRADGLVILGYNDIDTGQGQSDHIYQANVLLPIMLAEFLVARWNAIDPADVGKSCFIGDLPTPWNLSSCVKTEILPADYMATSSTDYLPGVNPSAAGVTPPPASSSTSLLFWFGAAALAGVGAWYATRPARLENIRGGRARSMGLHPSDFDPKALRKGTIHELEHTDDMRRAQQTAMDHLAEDEAYYEKLDALERMTFRLDNASPERAQLDRAVKRAQKLLREMAEGDDNWEKLDRAISRAEQLARFVPEEERDAAYMLRSHIREAEEKGRLARQAGREAELRRLRETEREHRAAMTDYERELELMRRRT